MVRGVIWFAVIGAILGVGLLWWIGWGDSLARILFYLTLTSLLAAGIGIWYQVTLHGLSGGVTGTVLSCVLLFAFLTLFTDVFWRLFGPW